MSEMPSREQMISAYSELVGLDPVSLGDGVARYACRWPRTCATAAGSCTAARCSR